MPDLWHVLRAEVIEAVVRECHGANDGIFVAEACPAVITMCILSVEDV